MRKNVKISPYGYWLSPVEYYFDEGLASSCLNLAKSEDCRDAYDIGCGSGRYVKLFNDNGFQTIGIDGNPSITGENLIIANLAEEVKLEPRDFILCLETGEHIPKQYEEIFIKNIVTHCKKILILSWARIGQAGHGHVNCKNSEDVLSIFAKYDFHSIDHACKTIKNATKIRWLKKNILVLKKDQS